MKRVATSIWVVSGGVFVLAYLASIYRYAGIENELVGNVLAALSALIFFGVVPALIIKYVYKEPLSDYGWKLPDLQSSKALVTGVVAIHVLAAVFLSTRPEYAAFYATTGSTFIITTLLSVIYFTAEEFLFRGFLLFTLWKRYRYVGVGVSVALFALLHFAKAPGEILVALVSGILLSIVALRTNSFVLPAVLHFIFALTLNVLVSFH